MKAWQRPSCVSPSVIFLLWHAPTYSREVVPLCSVLSGHEDSKLQLITLSKFNRLLNSTCSRSHEGARLPSGLAWTVGLPT